MTENETKETTTEELDATEDKSVKENGITFDDILHHVGEFGTFQKILYLMFSIPYVETAMQLLGWVFVGAIPR